MRALLALAVMLLAGCTEDHAALRGAQARTSGREQVVLFQNEVRDGARIDRDDPYLPPLDAEASENRKLNYERCRVSIDQAKSQGIVKQTRFDDPRLLFAVELDRAKWVELGSDEMLFDDLACFFAAGDARRLLRFKVLDEQGEVVGVWWGRWLPWNEEGEQ